MKITKRQLRRIIREEKKKIRENCGDVEVISHEIELPDAVAQVSESQSPEGELVVEMQVASRSLDAAIESISAAASLCPTCIHEVAAAAPLIDAMISQATALQETLDAVEAVVSESVDAVDDGTM